jgi:predicted tellurium resistance membrane protein TerC
MTLSWIFDILVSLGTLTFLELILGVDNLVFIAIVSQRLPEHKQKMARRFGLMLALVTRLLFLASVFWLAQLSQPLFTVFEHSFSARDLVFLFGGMFLLYKATQEIHVEISNKEEKAKLLGVGAGMTMVVIQIAVLDIVFSIDSVLTAVGMTPYFWLMASAIFIAILAMIFASEILSKLVKDNPAIKMLAFSFLLLVGTVLIADGLHFHVPRAYIYFAVCFSVTVELLNSLRSKRRVKKKQA